ncbi:hypothetical protein [Streptomyces hydrogenans]
MRGPNAGMLARVARLERHYGITPEVPPADREALLLDEADSARVYRDAAQRRCRKGRCDCPCARTPEGCADAGEGVA